MNFRVPHLLVAMALASSVTAQEPIEEEVERWFKVELLVFTHETGAGASSEQWNALPLLEYPDEFRFLVEPELVAQNLSLHDADSEVDAFGRQILTLHAPVVAGVPGMPLTENITADTYEEALPDIEQETLALADALEPGAEQPVETLTPTPYVALPVAEHTLRGKAAYMRRSGRHETLLHKAWVQPFESRENTLPIVLDRSGDQQMWSRLQGSVRIYLSRYLHLETNVWLNTQGQYLPGSWRMEAPPLSPLSVIIEEPEIVPLETGLDLALGSEQQASGSPDSAAPYARSRSGETAAGYEYHADTATEEIQETVEPPAPVYPYRHAVLLQQKRRMRSTEVHYIDHPMFGVVIRIDPLTEEDLHVRGEAELAAAEAQAEAGI